MRLNPDPADAVNATRELLTWLGENPVAVAIVGGVVVVVLVARGAMSRAPISVDPQRAFSGAQRVEAFRRAGGRCEHSVFGFRCRRPGQHADHIFPHSRGGATALSNCQSLCQTHNLRKGARVPGSFYVGRLVSRRRRYFPEGVSPLVEWRIGSAA